MCPHLPEERAPVSSSVPSDSHQVCLVHLASPLWSPAMSLLCALRESERWRRGGKEETVAVKYGVGGKEGQQKKWL